MAKAEVTTGKVLEQIWGTMQGAHEKTKVEKTLPKAGGNLPGGVNGVARLVEVKFGLVEKEGDFHGKPYFSAAGIVVAPQFHTDGSPIAGLRTSIFEMLCDTPPKSGTKSDKGRYTVADHLKWIYEQLRGLGVDTSKLTKANMEATFQALITAKVHFRFHTWQPPTPTEGQYAGKVQDVKHFWDGAVKYVPAGGVQQTAISDKSAAPANGAAASTATKAPPATTTPARPGPTTAPKPGGKTGPKSKSVPAPEPEPEPELSEGEEGKFDDGAEDLDALAATANGDDDLDETQDARVKLSELAAQAGVTDDQIEQANNWDEVVVLIRSGGEGAGDDQTEPGEPTATYSEGDMARFRPVDARTKKPGKAIDVTVVSCDEEAGTVVLRNMADRKTLYKNVPFAQVLPVE